MSITQRIRAGSIAALHAAATELGEDIVGVVVIVVANEGVDDTTLTHMSVATAEGGDPQAVLTAARQHLESPRKLRDVSPD